jgi:hypothetical protein
MNTALPRSRWNFPLTLLCLLLYLALLAWAQLHHEPWEDEIHSWNIAKASASLADLFQNIRYEGHPPLWYILLWIVSKCPHNLQGIQLLQYANASLAVTLILFRSPFPILARALLPFGYYFIYEYGCLSRNYALGLCLAVSLLIVIREQKGSRWYYPLLFLLANSHLLGILLAISIHSFMMMNYWRESTSKVKWLHAGMGLLAILPAFVFIIPPGDSELNFGFWMKHWNTQMPGFIATAPLRSFFPLPVWWDPHFWNTHFLIQLATQSGFIKLMMFGASAGLFVVACLILKKDRNALRLFLLNTALTAAFGLWFPISTARYVGFFFVGFIASVWLHKNSSTFTLSKTPLLYFLLALQIPGAFVALYRDWKLPFSNASTIDQLVKKVPVNANLIADYFALNPLLTFIDHPYYCIEAKRELNCILWTNEMTKLGTTPDPYKQGADHYLNEHLENKFYLISSKPLEVLLKRDTAFASSYHLRPVDSLTGAIDKYSNYYLYEVRR